MPGGIDTSTPACLPIVIERFCRGIPLVMTVGNVLLMNVGLTAVIRR